MLNYRTFSFYGDKERGKFCILAEKKTGRVDNTASEALHYKKLSSLNVLQINRYFSKLASFLKRCIMG